MGLLKEYLSLLEANASDFMRGGCFALALWLHKRTGLPLYGLFDERGTMHHAFVVDVDTEEAFDARGSVPLEFVGVHRGVRSAGEEVRPTTVEEVNEFRTMAEEFRGPFSNGMVAGYVRKTPALANLISSR